MRARILYIDAHDSFSCNIMDLLQSTLQADIFRCPIDEPLPGDDKEAFLNSFHAVVLGPGPGNPMRDEDVGLMNWIFEVSESLPIMGICLGFQLLCYRYGGKIKRLPEPRHGRVVNFTHCQGDIFKDVGEGIEATLYHSLQVRLYHPAEEPAEKVNTKLDLWRPSSTCPNLLPLAWYRNEAAPKEANLMAVRHLYKPYFGLQFHPESCKSSIECRKLILNWWALSSIYNISNRKISSPPPIPHEACSHTHVPHYDDIVQMLLRMTQPPDYHNKDVDLSKLTTEKVYEIIDIPNTPRVVLELDDRYSILSVPSPTAFVLEYSIQSKHMLVSSPFGTAFCRRKVKDPLDVHKILSVFLLSQRIESKRLREIPFWGGFLGFLSYEMGLVATLGKNMKTFDKVSTDMHLFYADRSIVIDHQAKKIYLQTLRREDSLAGQWLDMISSRLKQFSQADSLDPILLNLAVTSNRTIEDNIHPLRLKVSDDELALDMINGAEIEIPDKEAYKEKIAKCQKLIRDGESYELCLTDETRITLPTCKEDPAGLFRAWLLYKKLRKHNPGRYSAFLSIGPTKVISSSPECYMRWDRNFRFEMMPMKGTVRKDSGVSLETARALLQSPKEMAENLMIADLIRHDLNKLCGDSSTHIRRLLDIEEHARVYQMVTHIEAKPKPSHDIFLKARKTNSLSSPHDILPLLTTLPPGSMTGAPKVRSCGHLQEIEYRSRGAYSGVMGYMDIGGGGSFSVLIRAAFSSCDQSSEREIYRVGAGGAITALSDPEAEWEEMLTKLSTVLAIFDPHQKYRNVVDGEGAEKKYKNEIYIPRSVTRKMLEEHRGRVPKADMDEETKRKLSTAVATPVNSTFKKDADDSGTN